MILYQVSVSLLCRWCFITVLGENWSCSFRWYMFGSGKNSFLWGQESCWFYSFRHIRHTHTHKFDPFYLFISDDMTYVDLLSISIYICGNSHWNNFKLNFQMEMHMSGQRSTLQSEQSYLQTEDRFLRLRSTLQSEKLQTEDRFLILFTIMWQAS